MAVKNQNGHIVVERSGRKLWGTDLPPVNTFPELAFTVDRTISFPDFPKDFVYGYAQHTEPNPDPFGDPVNVGYCLTLTKIIPSELADTPVVIGSVPAGCNYIDVRADFSWVDPPDASAGSPVQSPVASGQRTQLQGGSCVLEVGNGFRRGLHVGLFGTSVTLMRLQSSRGGQPMSYSPWGGPTQFGWSYGSHPEGTIQNQIDGKWVAGFQGQPFVPPYRGSSTACSTAVVADFSSTWQVQFIITPGRVNGAL